MYFGFWTSYLGERVAGTTFVELSWELSNIQSFYLEGEFGIAIVVDANVSILPCMVSDDEVGENHVEHSGNFVAASNHNVGD